MFIICKEGHLGLYCEGRVFVEKASFVTTSRKQCLEYLLQFMDKAKAVEIITVMQKTPMTWYSF